MNKHFLSITDVDAKEIWQVLIMAKKLKEELKSKGKNELFLKGKQMVMLFEKPSLRTKLSFDMAINQLGGHSIYFGPQEVGLGKREEVTDVSKVISSMADLVVARVFSHKELEKFAAASQVPVINALSDKEHPCQALADLLTIYEMKVLPADRHGELKGLKVAFMGDSKNNVATSLKFGCEMLGINFVTNNPVDANIVYTDTWVSMGNEAEKEKNIKIFKKYQVNKKLMSLAKPDAIFMHCLPAHRGLEVTDEVIDGVQSVVFEQAENRLHAQKALLLLLFKGDELYE